MNAIRWLGPLGLALAVSAGAAAQVPHVLPPTQAVLRDAAAVEAFQQRIDDYVLLHRLLESSLVPPLHVTRHMEEVTANQRALAQRIVLTRQNAKEGDLLAADVARIFRRRIAACLPPEVWAGILAELAEDEQGQAIPDVALRVNMTWPADVPFGFVPPQLLAVLPPLPPELQYRIIGRSLVLWDHHANLILDFLPAAFTT
jgi:hypothetical protein